MFQSLAKELREFILRGNVLDMAVGIIIGSSFKSIVDSMVNDIIMPPIGMLLGKVDFSNLYLQISPTLTPETTYPSLEAAKAAGAVTLNYGAFINNVISFLIVACAVFAVIKAINTLKDKVCKEEVVEAEATTKECPFCCSTISINAKRCPNCTSEI